MNQHAHPAIAYEVREFLDLFKISRTAFYEEVKKGRLPIKKRGRKTIIAATDAHKWFEGAV